MFTFYDWNLLFYCYLVWLFCFGLRIGCWWCFDWIMCLLGCCVCCRWFMLVILGWLGGFGLNCGFDFVVMM